MELGEVIMRESAEREGWHEIQVPAYGMVVRFRDHDFNGTQEVSFVDEDAVTDELGVMGIARLSRLVGDWARENAGDIIF